jgi:hypothetical protein
MALRHARRCAARCGVAASRSSVLGDGVPRCVAPRLSRGLAGAATTRAAVRKRSSSGG